MIGQVTKYKIIYIFNFKAARNFDFGLNSTQKFTATTPNIPTSFHPTANNATLLTFVRPQVVGKDEIMIFNTIERDETYEEYEERKAKEDEEKKKKKGGKVEETDTGLKKIK